MKGDLTAFQKAKLLPTFKFQINSKNQIPNYEPFGCWGVWHLELEVWDLFGAWRL
jgi:hypothetical protein